MSKLEDSILLEDNETSYFRIGKLNLWLRRRHSDWLLNYQHDDVRIRKAPEEPTAVDDMEESTWQRWAFNDQNDTVLIESVMPDRPLVVRPIIPLSIHPKTSVNFLVRVPLWIAVKIKNPKANILLKELPSEILSDTWFGTPFEGELCYALKSPAARSMEELKREGFFAISQVTISNNSPEILPVSKFTIRVDYLSIYESENMKWANDVVVNFRDKKMPTLLNYSTKPPKNVKNAELIKASRKMPDNNLIRKTIGNYFNAIL